MGNAIIIQGADWSAKNLGRVTFIKTDELTIMGMTSIDGVAEYVAILGGNAVDAQWQVNDASIVELSATQGETITLTPLASGNIILSALYEDKTASLTINVVVEEEDENAITENDLSADMMRYLVAYDATRSVIYIPFNLDNADSWSVEMSVKDSSPIIAGVQYHDYEYVVSSDTSAPTQLNVSNVCYDSGWVSQGGKVIGDEDNNKSNSVGQAENTRRPSYIAVVFTYLEGTTGMPSFDEFMQYVSVRFTHTPRTTKIITQADLTVADWTYFTSAGGTRALIYLYLYKYHKWNFNLAVASDSTIKVGVQYHDYQHVATGSFNAPEMISWDSGWITPGNSLTCDQTKNKSNTVGTAYSSLEPTSIALAYTNNSSGSGHPDLSEFLKYVEFELELIPNEI